MRTSLLLALAILLTLAFPGAPPSAAAPLPPFDVAYRDAAAAMSAAGTPYANWAAAGRRFLEFDAADGTAVEVLGDLATAAHVAVLVPGVDTRLSDFDRGLGGIARRAPAVQARSIYARLRADDPHTRVAVVAWLGYDPPEGTDLDAVREDRARAGAAALAAFVRGVLAQRPGIGVTLIGHSYGAIVVGLAAPRLPAVADLVALGAPGMGTHRAAELGGARVWSALAPHDWIRRVPQVRLLDLGHGRRPSSPEFGARPLPTAGVAGHDYYLVPGSATLSAVADVVLGRPVGAVPAAS
jgi:pimeloyl-ACP methyl ester carboxylesterase